MVSHSAPRRGERGNMAVSYVKRDGMVSIPSIGGKAPRVGWYAHSLEERRFRVVRLSFGGSVDLS